MVPPIPVLFYKVEINHGKIVSYEAQEVLLKVDLKQMSSDPQAFKIYPTVIYYRLNLDKSKELQINSFPQ